MTRLLISFILIFLLLWFARSFARHLFAAYFDGRQSRGGEHPHANPHARQSGARAAHVLTEEEAYEVLGLEEGATLEEIGEAHRRLMKRIHPDTGGSGWLAAKLNAARDVLVKTHN